MDVRVEDRTIDDLSVTLTILIPASEVDALERGAYQVVAQRNGIEADRQATAKAAVEKALSQKRAAELATEALKNFVAPFALSQESENYSVVGSPVFDEGKHICENGDLLLKATWVRLPPVELSSYEPVEVTVPKTVVTEEELDARMEEIANSYKTLERDNDRTTVEDGAIVQISMECLKDGKRLDQLSFVKRPYRAGSGQMPQGFDEALDGLPVGATARVDFVLPTREGVDGEMMGPSIGANVTVEAIMKEVGRVLTDEFVRANIPGADTLSDLREQSRKEIEQKKDTQMRHFKNHLAATELAKRVEGAIPDAAYDAVANQMISSLEEQARIEGETVSELLEAQGTNENEYRMSTLMQARSQLRQSAALDAWVRHHGMTLTEEDLDAFFSSSVQDKAQADAMRKEIENGGYLYLAREGALRLKANDDLLAHAIVHETEPDNDALLNFAQPPQCP